MFKTYTGIEYLAIDISNHYGLDKKNFEDRIQWVKDNWSNLEAFSDKADEPMLYRKAVMNIRRAAKGERTGHMVALDASNSGIQIMSSLTGCHKGAYSTGLVDPDNRMDAYALTQNAMNRILGLTGDDALAIDRKRVKEAVMTAVYGSKAKPKEVFGEGEPLTAFYKAADEIAEGAFSLLDDLLCSWQSYAYSHDWIMPDGDHIHIKVMQKVEKQLEIDELNHYNMTAQYKINKGTKSGVANAANVVHSLDGYLLRTMVRRCNYNKDITEIARNNIQIELMARYPNYKLGQMSEKVAIHYNLYVQTNMLDTAIVPYLTLEQCEALPTEYLTKLNTLLGKITEHAPFTIEAVHDA